MVGLAIVDMLTFGALPAVPVVVLLSGWVDPLLNLVGTGVDGLAKRFKYSRLDMVVIS